MEEIKERACKMLTRIAIGFVAMLIILWIVEAALSIRIKMHTLDSYAKWDQEQNILALDDEDLKESRIERIK